MALLLTGCTQIKTVYVPVSHCEPPPPFTMPTILVDNLTPTATTQDKLQAIKTDHGTMRRSLEQCILLLDGYRKPSR